MALGYMNWGYREVGILTAFHDANPLWLGGLLGGERDLVQSVQHRQGLLDPL